MSESKTQSGIDRRSFLRSTAAVGAGLAFAPRMFAAASGGEKDINVALLGAGAEGQILMEACRKIPNVKFKAVCDIWEAYNQKRVSRLLDRYGHPNNTYVDYKEMLEKEKGKIDAVIIATPDFWHAEHAIACMEAGLDVYCEKEMSNDLAKARQMVECPEEDGQAPADRPSAPQQSAVPALLQQDPQGRQDARPDHDDQRAVESRRPGASGLAEERGDG